MHWNTSSSVVGAGRKRRESVGDERGLSVKASRGAGTRAAALERGAFGVSSGGEKAAAAGAAPRAVSRQLRQCESEWGSRTLSSGWKHG